MKINRQGCTRIVFVFDKFVIKIPNIVDWKLFLWGILANIHEKDCTGLHEDLAKVLWAEKHGFLLVMEKAEVIQREEAEKLEVFLHERYKNDKLKDFMLSDPKYCNWGRIKGRIVKIDYGE